ncbi:hypothetical protein TGAM01_v201326 [Trichoderma gamsii]|uniref:Uncharacterized protein n=1 Tax=Trichoderma gamsii TaxID=398673 RepID=A0A2P5A086_9HYPO|nr:hypothetical protein TGAM01_v201326 [Trichoderma gamsii]PON29960.1 hypothetical protein TGAM01_v201326 [Trichoderma gamsii]
MDRDRSEPVHDPRKPSFCFGLLCVDSSLHVDSGGLAPMLWARGNKH